MPLKLCLIYISNSKLMSISTRKWKQTQEKIISDDISNFIKENIDKNVSIILVRLKNLLGNLKVMKFIRNRRQYGGTWWIFEKIQSNPNGT